jgi:beta-glucosidase
MTGNDAGTDDVRKKDAAKLDVEKVLSELTLDEKATLTSGVGFWNTAPIERLGVPSITLSDGPHGIRRSPEGDQIGIGDSYPATCFPPATALGSSWDPELAETVGRALGQEANALDVQVLLGPGINIKRSPLCGRNFEYFSEDPLVSGELGAALIRGVQSQGVGTSLKHFAANNQETDRLRVSADVDERTLREIYLAGFERAVKDAEPSTVMCSYNRINGVYASENRWLLTDVLRDEWGYDGLVVSDWGAVNERPDGVRAGLDLEMPGTAGVGPDAVIAAVRNGSLDEAELDAATRSVLTLVAEHAAGIRPADAGEPALAPELAAEHHELARTVAARCAVLLKNDGGILPLKRDASIAVIGEFARTPRYQGAGSSQIVPTELDSPLGELRRLSAGTVTFAAGYPSTGSGTGPSTSSGTGPSTGSGTGHSASSGAHSSAPDLLAEAVAAASAADVAVLFIGLPASAESEGFDRTDIDLPAEQIALLDAVAEANENLVVVLSNGSVVKISDWNARAQAILEGWLLGQAGGGAIADILFGIANPSGRLAETIPLRLEDNPSYLNFPGAFGHVSYGEGVFVGYRWYDARKLEVSYPFGHGLSYTQFAYSDLAAEFHAGGTAPTISVSFTITNTGSVAGREVAQVYVQAPSSHVERPERELRAFRVVLLAPGESQNVTLTLGARDLAYFHPLHKEWTVESGTVVLHVGASSRDLRLQASVDVSVPQSVHPLDRDSTLAEWLAHPRGSQLLGAMLQSVGGDSPLTDPDTLAVVGSMPLKRIGRFPGVGLTSEMLDGMLQQANA